MSIKIYQTREEIRPIAPNASIGSPSQTAAMANQGYENLGTAFRNVGTQLGSIGLKFIEADVQNDTISAVNEFNDYMAGEMIDIDKLPPLERAKAYGDRARTWMDSHQYRYGRSQQKATQHIQRLVSYDKTSLTNKGLAEVKSNFYRNGKNVIDLAIQTGDAGVLNEWMQTGVDNGYLYDDDDASSDRNTGFYKQVYTAKAQEFTQLEAINDVRESLAAMANDENIGVQSALTSLNDIVPTLIKAGVKPSDVSSIQKELKDMLNTMSDSANNELNIALLNGDEVTSDSVLARAHLLKASDLEKWQKFVSKEAAEKSDPLTKTQMLQSIGDVHKGRLPETEALESLKKVKDKLSSPDFDDIRSKIIGAGDKYEQDLEDMAYASLGKEWAAEVREGVLMYTTEGLDALDRARLLVRNMMDSYINKKKFIHMRDMIEFVQIANTIVHEEAERFSITDTMKDNADLSSLTDIDREAVKQHNINIEKYRKAYEEVLSRD